MTENKTEYVEVDYETITTAQMGKLREIVNSSLLNALTPEDYRKIMFIFCGVIGRLEEYENG